MRHVPLPALIAGADPVRWREEGAFYLRHLGDTFTSTHVTNKRPDNFLYLGLINALFPNARIFLTRRQSLDNCLSVFFQQLDGRFTYANDILDTGHYLLQHQRMMALLQQRFGQCITAVDYEQLVAQPRAVLEPALHLLNLDWDDACLQFHASANRVRTASVAQVRQPLYAHASGRGRNYERELQPLLHYLDAAGGA